MLRRRFAGSTRQRVLSILTLAAAMVAIPGCGLELPEVKPPVWERFDLSQIAPASHPPRPSGVRITEFATEYVIDLGIPEGQPGHASEVRVVLPNPMPADRVPALVINGSGAYLFSGMVLSDEDIDPMLPYVERGFAVVAYETDGCQPSFDREPTAVEIAQMTRHYVQSKAGLINAQRALSYALDRFPEIDGDQLYAMGHSSGGKQALLLAIHDDRIRGCVAFAPACQLDFGSRMTVAGISGPDASFLVREVERSMPISHAGITRVPMLLVYSPDDSITRPAEVLTYAKAVGKVAMPVPVRCKGHGAIPDAGFKMALTWLRARCKKLRGELTTTMVSRTEEETSQSVASDQEVEVIADAQPQQDTPLPVDASSTPMPTQNPYGIRHNPYAAD